ncbi:MAG TPA: tRNA (adenosine(37)-N6)-threonylcarbamoyltransferase complex ATPase subunit type 1 TsaE [Vicinamibacterales bacterium]|nr:tRNA (adenosine(37)-N6)-threonylcarbamoyltransferase complex ATPase subunit type 1 TsaE [Vicinamibacterales bacterium]
MDRYRTGSETETTEVAARLAATLAPGTAVLLFGDLGAGKTTFVRGLAAGLGIDPEEVSSPTFTIVQEYRGGRLPLYHVDLYRLEGREVDDLGLDELREEAVMAIEWADRLPRRLPGPVVLVHLREAGESTREIAVERPAEAAAGESAEEPRGR